MNGNQVIGQIFQQWVTNAKIGMIKYLEIISHLKALELYAVTVIACQ